LFEEKNMMLLKIVAAAIFMICAATHAGEMLPHTTYHDRFLNFLFLDPSLSISITGFAGLAMGAGAGGITTLVTNAPMAAAWGALVGGAGVPVVLYTIGTIYYGYKHCTQ
jgi:hypothetical protein